MKVICILNSASSIFKRITMYLKYLIIIVFTIIVCVSSEMTHNEQMYSDIFVQIESLKKSIEILKVQQNAVNEINSFSAFKQSLDGINTRLDILINYSKSKQDDCHCKGVSVNNDVDKKSKAAMEEEIFAKKSLFDVRVDKLPESKKKQCQQDPAPIDCKSATKCTQKSGYYRIYISEEKQIMVFCDMKINGGNWMYIFRRIDGSLDFDRDWTSYLEGFGNVKEEYWIGLQNLYALTKNNGRQQLYVHMEDFNGQTYYALYDNFVIADANERFKLISVGNYNGTAVDELSYNVGGKFEISVDSYISGECSWWHNTFSNSCPSNSYFEGRSGNVGISWGGYFYKSIYFMIRNF